MIISFQKSEIENSELIFHLAGMDSGRYAMQNIPGDILFECGRQFAEYGGHNVESVSEETLDAHAIIIYFY